MKIKLTDIKVGERFREKFEDIDLLAESILKHGLIEPIVVDENNNLIAGERRYRAHQFLKMDTIEVKYMNDLSQLQKMEIELEENIMRRAFTWQEEVTAKAKLHKIKQETHGAAIKGHESEGTWKLKDTALALGESTGRVSEDIQLARGMKAFPELMKEKSKSTAYKKMKQLQEQILNEELAKRLKQKGIINHPDIINGNCIEVMSKMPADSVDLIITDPPYGIDIGDAGTFGRSSEQKTYADGEFETFDMLDKAIKEMYRILRPDRHMYMFFGIDKYEQLKKLLEKHGFWVHHLPLIWDKTSGSYASQSTTYVHSYEPFFHCMKGKRKLNGTPKDLFTVKRTPSNLKIHPSEKPTELLRDLINLSSLPGETVFDAFAGSGSTLAAAKETSRKAIGIELDTEFYHKTCKRLSTEQTSNEDNVDISDLNDEE